MSGDRPSPLVIERILRDRQGIWQQIVSERDLNALTGRMLASSASRSPATARCSVRSTAR